MKQKKQIKTIRDQIMQLPDPLNHLVIEILEATTSSTNLNDPPYYAITYLENIDDYTTPIGCFRWPTEYEDMFCAIAHEAIYHKIWEVRK
jgi:hypothetical protein